MKRTLRGFAIILLGAAIWPHLLIAETKAASLFKAKCALCHGEDGSGNTPTGKAQKAKDLRSEETQKKSDAEIAEVITKGRNKMPAFAQKLKPDQIQQLVAYVRQLPKK
jgi:mono/diheme cytochrome c family protein